MQTDRGQWDKALISVISYTCAFLAVTVKVPAGEKVEFIIVGDGKSQK